MSVPPKKEYELVKIDEAIKGKIVKVEEDQEHKFVWQGKESFMHGVRIWFSLEGYKDDHPTRWMKFLYTERANLYKKYLVPLVQGMKPNIQWDIQDLTGMSVITYWNQQESNGTTYQHIETIIPDGKKMYPVIVEAGKTEDAPPQDDGDVPF